MINTAKNKPARLFISGEYSVLEGGTRTGLAGEGPKTIGTLQYVLGIKPPRKQNTRQCEPVTGPRPPRHTAHTCGY